MHFGVGAVPTGAWLDEKAVEVDGNRDSRQIPYPIMDAPMRDVDPVERESMDDRKGRVEAYTCADIERLLMRLHNALRRSRHPGKPQATDDNPSLHPPSFLFADRPAELANRVA